MGRDTFSGGDALKLLEALEKQDDGALAALGVKSLDEITWLDLSGSDLTALPPEIGRLTNLETLRLYNTQLSALPPEIGRLTNLQWLDLSNTQLSSLPPEIGRLTNLQRLDLSYTQLSILPSEIGWLTMLQRLDMDNTQLSALPPEIGRLTSLKELSLSNTQLSALPPEIGRLTKLQTLSLFNTQLSALPPEIGRLTKLQTLYLHNTQLSALPPEIGRLTSLKELSLYNTQLSTLPPEIGCLTKLQTLSLSDIRLSALPLEIGRLTKLQTLSLSDTRLSALPPEIGCLTKLQTLDLSNTQLSALPPEIGRLTNLQWLRLDNTQLSALPPEIGLLTSLQWLSIGNTGIQKIPDWIGDLKDLRYLNISGLCLKEIPKAVFDLDLPFFLSEDVYREKLRSARSSRLFVIEKGVVMENTVLRTQPVSLFGLDREMIRAYYEEEKVPVREGKVIFLGDGGAGKSHTIERILKSGRDEGIDTEQTPGISIRLWKPDRGRKQVSINFWDFGGQEILHAMHRCFLTDRSLYVVVLRQRSESRHNDLTLQARYWLENIRSFAPNCPVILAVNREQGVAGSSGVNTRQLREELGFQTIVGEPIVYCARADREDNFGVLTERILEQTLLLDSTEMEFPRTWSNVRSALETMSNRRDRRGSKPYIDKGEYQKLCMDQGITDENIRRWLLEWFNDLGVCFSYHQEDGKELERYQVLNPEWLTNAIYAIILIGRRQEFSDNGVITRSEIDRILRREILEDPAKHEKERTVREPIAYEDDEQGYVLDIMRKFNLCAQLDERRFYIPALCSPETPENFRPGAEEYTDHTRFEFRYSFLPDSVIHRLMIECIRAGFHRTASYFGGIRVDFDTDGVTLTAEADTAKNVLSVDIYHKNDPDASRSKLAWVRRKVTEINAAMNLTPDCEILVVYDGENRADLRLDYLFRLHERGKKTTDLPAQQEGEIVECDLDAALRLLYSDRVVRRADRILKYADSGASVSYRDALVMAEAEEEERKERMKSGMNLYYTLGVSFAGEQRDFVRQVCESLCKPGGFDREEMFFDEWRQALITGPNADMKLDKIYSKYCQKVVVLFSEAYLSKPWTNKLEWTRAITNRITEDPDNVCLLRYGNVDIDSIVFLHGKKDIVTDVSGMTPQEAADFILEWYNSPAL